MMGKARMREGAQFSKLTLQYVIILLVESNLWNDVKKILLTLQEILVIFLPLTSLLIETGLQKLLIQYYDASIS